MPYFLLQKNHQKRIQLLTQEEANAILRQEGRSITPISHCYTADLTGINVYNASSPLPIGIWPTVDALFSKDLIEHLGLVLFHENSVVIQQNATRIINNATANDRCADMELPFCKDRSLIAIIISKQVSPACLQEEKLDYIHKPNLVFELGIPCVPVHQLDIGKFCFAYSECLDRFHGSSSLPWLSTPESIYQHLIQPYLHCIKTLHDKHLTHGDIDESNVVLSKRHGRLIFVDFKHVGDVPYVEPLDAGNEKGYYAWQKARLLDLAQMAICVLNLVSEYTHEAAHNNAVIAYLQSVADTLDELLDFHDNCHNDDVEAEKNCITKHQEWTIDRIIQGVCEAHQTPQVAFNFFEPASSPSKRQKITSSKDDEVIESIKPLQK